MLVRPAAWIRFSLKSFLSKFRWRALRDPIWLELGSGEKVGTNGWTTVDMSGADIFHDLRRGIPLSDGSVDKIYTSHLLEHIPYSDLKVFIGECHRVLRRGGELSVSVPNARFYISAYINKENFRDIGKGFKPALVQTDSWIDQVNYIAYMGGHHHYMFDEQNLINTIKLAPFSKVTLRNFDPFLDMAERDFESIYASAVK